jgi:hypothetical protein
MKDLVSIRHTANMLVWKQFGAFPVDACNLSEI